NIDKILERVGLIEKKQNFPYQLSGGQQQRVAIARALIIDPKIIFADEPTGNLDSKAGEEILKLLYNLSKENNKTVLMVTHDNYAASFSDRIIKIKDGVIE
ncbi:MAG: putative transport system ATP-binding protein, partial [Thermoanaerobacter sp.]|nr:putative transport system ATP-binding protein [Thermoanaerobacter sp.]